MLMPVTPLSLAQIPLEPGEQNRLGLRRQHMLLQRPPWTPRLLVASAGADQLAVCGTFLHSLLQSDSWKGNTESR